MSVSKIVDSVYTGTGLILDEVMKHSIQCLVVRVTYTS